MNPSTDPLAVLRTVLASARRAGYPFEQAWAIGAEAALGYTNERRAHEWWDTLAAPSNHGLTRPGRLARGLARCSSNLPGEQTANGTQSPAQNRRKRKHQHVAIRETTVFEHAE